VQRVAAMAVTELLSDGSRMARRSSSEQPDVREKLVRGAFDVLADDGVEGLTVRRIAEAAGRSTMCVYTKFGNRRSLLQEVYRRAQAELTEALRQVRPVDGDTVLGIAAAYRRFARRRPELYSLLFEHPLEPLELDAATRQETIAGVVERIGGPNAHTVWATMHGLLVLERSWSPTRQVPWSGATWSDYYTATLRGRLTEDALGR
jgi:AcrR family transcriptional regulator